MDSDLEEDTEVDTLILVSLGAGGVRLSRHADKARARTHTHTHTPTHTHSCAHPCIQTYTHDTRIHTCTHKIKQEYTYPNE